MVDSGTPPGAPDPGAPQADAGSLDAGDPFERDAASQPAFVLSSSAFAAGERLPNLHSCVGGSVSPPLSWSEGPPGTQSYAVALITRDQTWQTVQQTAHWVVWDIHAQELPQGIAAGDAPSNVVGARQTNVASGTLPLLGTPPAYVAPCVLTGIDEFEFVVYALSVAALPVTTPVTPEVIVGELESDAGLALARSVLPFTFP